MKNEQGYLAYSLRVMGKRWTIYYCTEGFWKRRGYLDDTLGISEMDDKEIYLRIKHFRKETTTHELTHAYLWELCLWSLRKEQHTAEQLEEAFCDLMAKYGKKLLKQVEEITSAYAILKGRRA